MTLGDRIRSGVKWLLAGSVGNQALTFVFGVVLARLLTPGDFGLVLTIQIFTGIAGFLSGGGMGQALIQAKQVEPHHYQVVFTVQLAMGSLIYGLFFVIAPWFAQWFEQPIYESLLRISALSFFLRPFVNTARAKLHREMRFKATALTGVAGMFSAGCASTAMALMEFGVWSLVVGGMVGTLITIVIYLVLTRWRPGLCINIEVAKRLALYGIKITVNDILIYAKSQASNLILSAKLGPAMVGLYNRADSLSDIPKKLVMDSLYQAIFRALSKEQENLDLSKYIFYRSITLSTVYAIPGLLLLWWLAEPFILVVYGEKWLPAAQPLEILTLIGLLLIGSPSGALLAAQNQLGREIAVTLETLAIMVLGTLLAAPWGLEGIAWVIVMTRLYSNLRLYLLARQCIGGTLFDLVKALTPAYTLNGLLFVVLFITHSCLPHSLLTDYTAFYLMVMGTVGAGCYLLFILYIPIPALTKEAERWRNLLNVQRLLAQRNL